MRLLQSDNDGNLSLTEFFDSAIPNYAILSHRWGTDEVTFKDLTDGTSKSKAGGYSKIQFCEDQARRDGLKYYWIDTCCIDKSSSAELSEAINSMFRWYQEAARCYVYLSDVSTRDQKASDACTWESAFRASQWFTRGWTLQELLAPRSVEFYSREGNILGDKRTLEQQIHEITGIPTTALRGNPLSQFDVNELFSWAKGRQTTRGEDKAYALFGIFDVQIPLLYGEGEVKAFLRLREAVDRPLKGKPYSNDWHSWQVAKVQANPALMTSRPAETPEIPPNPSTFIPFSRDADFVKRGILDQIHQKCAVSGSRTALVGLGGVGKSQLAIEYAYRARDRSPETWVFWVHASNAARFEQSFRDIADRAKIFRRQNPTANIFQLVHDWLLDDRKGKWVLILDNMDDASFLIEAQSTAQDGQTNGIESGNLRPLVAYLPQCPHGSILITTRSRDMALKLVEQRNIIEVEPMSKADALELFASKLGGDDSSDDATELVAALEFMPLAIVQAAAYISQRAPRYSVRDYLRDFEKSDRKRTSLLDREGGQLRRDREAKNSILITWQISFDYIRKIRPSAADLLSLMSFFDRQGIPEDLLRSQDEQRNSRQDQEERSDGNAVDSDDDDNGISQSSVSNGFEEDVLALRDYSFISINTDGTTFEMHGLVQLATREWLKAYGQQERWREQFIKNLDSELPTGGYKNWARCQTLFPHAQSAAAQQPEGQDSLKDWASILYKAAWYAWTMGKGVEAENMSIQAMKVRKRILGREHNDTLSSMLIVGLAYELRGKYDLAEPLCRETLQLREKVLGKEHPQTLTSMNNLAGLFASQGKYDLAEPLYRETLQLREKVLGKEHPDTLMSMNNLALLFKSQGKYDLAEPLYRETLQLREKVLGKEHPDTLSSMNNLAALFASQGKYDLAEPLYRETLQLREKVLGKEHPDTLMSMNNLAGLLKSQGKSSRQRTVVARRRCCGGLLRKGTRPS